MYAIWKGQHQLEFTSFNNFKHILSVKSLRELDHAPIFVRTYGVAFVRNAATTITCVDLDFHVIYSCLSHVHSKFELSSSTTFVILTLQVYLQYLG